MITEFIIAFAIMYILSQLLLILQLLLYGVCKKIDIKREFSWVENHSNRHFWDVLDVVYHKINFILMIPSRTISAIMLPLSYSCFLAL